MGFKKQRAAELRTGRERERNSNGHMGRGGVESGGDEEVSI